MIEANPEPRDQTASANASHYTPRSAFLEFGSTSIKFYVVGLLGDSAGRVERELKFPWELGYDVFEHARISPSTVTRCLGILRKLGREFPDVPLETVTAVGTSALREAQNADLFQRVLWDELRLRIHIIEGGIEAFLLETGFRDAVKSYPTGLFDLGGGSLELVEYLSAFATKKTSMPVGAIRLHCQLRHTRDLFEYIEEGRRIVGETLRQHLAGQTPPYRELTGTGGTVRAIVEILGKEEFHLADMRELIQSEVRGPVWEQLASHRRKALLPGIIAVEGLFVTLDLERVVYRTASVKSGLMTLMQLLPAAALKTG